MKTFVRVLISGFLVCAMVLKGHAQILNIEKFRLDKDTANIWLGNVNFGFAAKKQQTNVFTLGSNVNIAYLSKLHSYMFLSNIKLVQVRKQDVISEGYGHLRFNFLRRRKLSYEQFTQMQYDVGRGMNSRFLTGVNMRYRLASNEKFELAFNTGAMYEDELWKNSEGEFIPNVGYKSTSNVTMRWQMTQALSIFTITYYQAYFNSFFTPRLITDTSLQLELGKHFSFRAQFVATYDADPVIDIDRLIFSLNNQIVFKF